LANTLVEFNDTVCWMGSMTSPGKRVIRGSIGRRTLGLRAFAPDLRKNDIWFTICGSIDQRCCIFTRSLLFLLLLLWHRMFDRQPVK